MTGVGLVDSATAEAAEKSIAMAETMRRRRRREMEEAIRVERGEHKLERLVRTYSQYWAGSYLGSVIQ